MHALHMVSPVPNPLSEMLYALYKAISVISMRAHICLYDFLVTGIFVFDLCGRSVREYKCFSVHVTLVQMNLFPKFSKSLFQTCPFLHVTLDFLAPDIILYIIFIF